VKTEITPQPSDEERAALVAALALLGEEEEASPYDSAWRRAAFDDAEAD
jgi:hypothetical protein